MSYGKYGEMDKKVIERVKWRDRGLEVVLNGVELGRRVLAFLEN